MSAPHRFLGFGFAAADLLVEIKADGRVSFALGAGEAVLGAPDQALAGRPWQSLFDSEDHPMVEAVFRGLVDGTRAGPVVLCVASAPGKPARYASLTAIRLAQNHGAISCALSRATGRGASGLQTREQFETRATELLAGSTEALELAFIEFSGLSQSDLAAAGLGGVTPEAASMPMTGVERPKQVAQALRYALNMVLQDGLSRPLPGDLSQALESAMRETLNKAGQLGAAIRGRRFTLAYQPVVSLRDGSLHHHEVLVRFGSEGSPFPTIRMAEEMDLIEPLDVAILDETLTVLKRDANLKLAVNVSGRSLMSDSYLSSVLKMLAERPWTRGRLMFELTESAAVEDLAVADRHIQALREAGCEVCLDDFGAGAASLAYLQQLTLDLLKIDGRYIRDLQHGGREATFVKHLVNMCGELKVRTLAEMVETPEAEDAVRRAGVDYAQGWLYGRARETPADDTAIAARGRARSGALAIRSALDR